MAKYSRFDPKNKKKSRDHISFKDRKKDKKQRFESEEVIDKTSLRYYENRYNTNH